MSQEIVAIQLSIGSTFGPAQLFYYQPDASGFDAGMIASAERHQCNNGSRRCCGPLKRPRGSVARFRRQAATIARHEAVKAWVMNARAGQVKLPT
jgi:hypothetical protein